MKHTLKRLFSILIVSCLLLTMFPFSVFASSANGSNIIEVLSRASKTGFYYNFDGDTSFDGSRIVSGTEQDISRLKASTQGTVMFDIEVRHLQIKSYLRREAPQRRTNMARLWLIMFRG